jgi:hypothetical protein
MIRFLTGGMPRREVHSLTPDPADSVMIHQPAQKSNKVTAIFENAKLSFEMACGTTLAQLVEELSILGTVHGGLPLSVDVRVPIDGPH